MTTCRCATGDISVLVSPGSVELLTGATLDYVEINAGERRFIFINPNDPRTSRRGLALSSRLDGAAWAG